MDLFLFNFLYESVANLQVMYTVLTVEPTEYLEYKIKDAIKFFIDEESYTQLTQMDWT